MVYTRRQPAVLIMGIGLLALAYCTEAGLLDGVLNYLGTSRSKAAMTTLPYIFGIVGAVIGLWQLLGVHRQARSTTTARRWVGRCSFSSSPC